MGDGTKEEMGAFDPTEEQDQQQFEAEVQQWRREYDEWWEAVDKDTNYIKEHDNASNGHRGTVTKEALSSK
tara:strand:+ start:1364 stop:1576 length:213 start_codon:yes stop_codon:yes gene_type:complete